MPKTIEEIYDAYKIMPNLREHMYRVASVASILCDHFSGLVDRKSILQTCLFHDMGNIVKFDLNKFPEFTKDKGFEYWKSVKEDFISKYNSQDAHEISLKIAEEIGVSLRALELLNSGGFDKAIDVLSSDEVEKKICLYADMRVAPQEVVSLSSRLDDLMNRYDEISKDNQEDKQEKIKAIYNIEKQIFKVVDIFPDFINEKNVQNIIPHLKNIKIH